MIAHATTGIVHRLPQTKGHYEMVPRPLGLPDAYWFDLDEAHLTNNSSHLVVFFQHHIAEMEKKFY